MFQFFGKKGRYNPISTSGITEEIENYLIPTNKITEVRKKYPTLDFNYYHFEYNGSSLYEVQLNNEQLKILKSDPNIIGKDILKSVSEQKRPVF